MSHNDVQRVAEQWDIALPVVRDLQAFGRDHFNVEQAPSIVVLDREGRVQLQETSSSPELGKQLQGVIEKLLAGENVASSYLQFVESQRDEYTKLLAAASLEPPTIELKPAAIQLSPVALPTQVRLRELWKNDRIEEPGNVIVSKRGLRQSLLVHSGLDSLAQLSAYGSVQQQFRLETPNGPTLMTSVRSASERDGQTFHLAVPAMGEQVHLFDDRWQFLTSYPDRSTESAASGNVIQDARLADLDDDGKLEIYVAFDGEAGVHRVNLRGRREWTNESVAPAYSLTISPDQTGRDFLLITKRPRRCHPAGQRRRTAEINRHSLMECPFPDRSTGQGGKQ